MFYTSPGFDYMVTFNARYSVLVDEDVMADQAEDKAWEMVEKALKDNGFEKKGEGYSDHKFEIYETKEISPSLIGYRVVLVVDFEVSVTTEDMDDAYNEAVDEVEGIELPENIKLMWMEQTDLMQCSERIMIAHGDDV